MPRLLLQLSLMLVALLPASPVLGQQATRSTMQPAAAPWTRGATCYEVFVRSFYDSDGDGVGDFRGLTDKLDYINDGDPSTQTDLGAQCIWLMPISPSPSYHGYDVTNYYEINRDYGTKEDFQRFVAEAHRRGIRILVDMVLNHSSNEHPFFKHAALHGEASPWRNFYHWLPQHPGFQSPWGSEHWHRSPGGNEFYYGLFWSGMPDLNVQNPALMEEAKKIATFWLQDMNVDGFRLDAIKHLVEADSGRRVDHLPGTHVVLREYAAHVRSVKPEAFTIGEVWDSTGAMLAYYPDQLDAHFAFEVSDAILNAVRERSAAGLLPPILRIQRELPSNRYSPFLRNHDQTRTVTALAGDLAAARLATTILLTIPGLPFVYYGEELGMTGDKPDPRLRTPMHWRRAPAAGFTTGMPWEPLQPDSLTANVEAQEREPNSLLNHHRRLIHLRARHPALADGELVPLTASHDAVAAWVRRDADSGRSVLVVLNLGTTPLRNVALASEGELLAAGRYTVAGLLGGSAGAALQLGRDGRLRGYAPLRTLAPQQGYLFELTAR